MSDGAPTCDVVVVGAGPCGIAAAISLKQGGFNVVVVEQGCVVQAITQYPTYATFFSTPEKLAIGGVPFICPEAKPTRRDALAYYRAVVAHFNLGVRQYERVEKIAREGDHFKLTTIRRGKTNTLSSRAIVMATGYWGSPNLLKVDGETLPHVAHVFREGHVAFDQDVVVVGGGNSAAEAALELFRAGARVSLVHFGPSFDKKIKPWILPDLLNRLAEGSVRAHWNSRVTKIDSDTVTIDGGDAGSCDIPAGLVFLLTGYAPNVELLRAVGVSINADTGIPMHDPDTLETDVPGVFIAGVVTAGFDANKVFIENGRYHGERIVAALRGEAPPVVSAVSRDLDGG